MTNRRMDKQSMVYSYNGVVFSNKKEWVTDTNNNMGESQKHYVRDQGVGPKITEE